VRLKGEKPKDKAYPKEVTTIGDAIRKRRLDLGLSQKDVAKIIGCDKASVLNWEKGYNTPRMNKMSGIRRFLGRDWRDREPTCLPVGMPRQPADLSKSKHQ
jgi:transcriptional regulator with XRE-family HTH domain